MKTDKRGHELDARMFLDKPTTFLLPAQFRDVSGLTVLNDELFVVQDESTQVNVYNTNTFTLSHNIDITGSKSLSAISSSSQHNCLYISDDSLKVVYRYNLSNKVITHWSVGGECYGLSETSTYSVLVTLEDTKQIKEYTTDGSLIREISLDSSMQCPWHSVQLSSDRLVVSHGWSDSLHRVCIVDMSGRIIQSYGGSRGSGVGQLYAPRHLAVDRYGNVLVTDMYNDRVVLLSPSLTHLGDITVSGHELCDPWALHLDQLNHRLYIGECGSSGRVIVLSA